MGKRIIWLLLFLFMNSPFVAAELSTAEDQSIQGNIKTIKQQVTEIQQQLKAMQESLTALLEAQKENRVQDEEEHRQIRIWVHKR